MNEQWLRVIGVTATADDRATRHRGTAGRRQEQPDLHAGLDRDPQAGGQTRPSRTRSTGCSCRCVDGRRRRPRPFAGSSTRRTAAPATSRSSSRPSCSPRAAHPADVPDGDGRDRVISLLVGGIGIMNIMLASVLERRARSASAGRSAREQAEIVRQFLIEATIISRPGRHARRRRRRAPCRGSSAVLRRVDRPRHPFSVVLAFAVSVAVGLALRRLPGGPGGATRSGRGAPLRVDRSRESGVGRRSRESESGVDKPDP